MGVRRNVPNRSSFILHPSSFIPRAFTLIEMLTVIVIIGILATLITAAAIRARTAAKNFAVRKEISDLQQALEAYKLKYLEYPPDFATFEPLMMDASLINIRRQAVLRHLRNGFPRYVENLDSRTIAAGRAPSDGERWNLFKVDLAVYGLNPDNFDHASALVFWLGGLPEQPPAAGQKWIPAGFHADKANPFKAGLPRTEPFFTFTADRLVPGALPNSGFAYTPPSIEQAPYVYFRARPDGKSERFEYGATNLKTLFVWYAYLAPSGETCFPYLNGYTGDPSDPNIANILRNPLTDRPWSDRQKFQIIAAGMDNQFGSGTAWRDLVTGLGITNADFDNITSFADGKLEDAMKQ
jgi:prepilin-type N-terminal cleavage/methylation domain-containing protein